MDDSKPSRRSQSSLWVLLAWVVGSAVFLGLVRGATGFWWRTGGPTGWGGWRINVERMIGVGLLASGTVVAAVIVGSLVARRRDDERRAVVFGGFWRVGALAYLTAIGMKISSLLRSNDEPVSLFAILSTTPVPMKILAMSAAIGLVGVLLGFSPVHARRRPTRARSSWGTLIVAGLGGVSFLACWDMNLCYLVLLALEAVRNALQRPGQMAEWVARGGHVDAILIDRGLYRSLHERVMFVGAVAVLALVACLLTARWLGRDLRRTADETGARRSVLGLSYRTITAVATWGLGLYLLFGTLPYLNPALVEGSRAILDSWGAAAIIAGFLMLSAGLSARGVAVPEAIGEPSTRSRRLRWVVLTLKAVLGFALIGLILAAISRIRDEIVLPGLTPTTLRDWLKEVQDSLTIQRGATIYFDPVETPEAIVLVVAFVGIALATIRLAFARRIPDAEAPIDRIGRSPAMIARWLGSWLAMLGVILTLFPALVLAAMAVVHLTARLTY